MKTAAVVLAAGKSERMGENKLLIKLCGKMLINHILDVLENSKINETVIVLGHNPWEIISAIKQRPEHIKTVVNERYEEGMASSFKTGLKEVENADAVFLVLGDQPFLNPKLINDMIEQIERNERVALIVCPVYAGKKGHPVLFSKSLFREISSLQKRETIRDIIHRHGNRILTMKTDRRTIIDIDTPGDLAKAAEFLEEAKTKE